MSTPRKPRRPRGKSIQWDDETLDRLSQVGPDDADAAAAWWDRYCPPEARGLIDSGVIDEDDDATGEL